MVFIDFYIEQSSAANDRPSKKDFFFVNRKMAVGSFSFSIDDEILFLLHEQYATLQYSSRFYF